MTTNTLSLASHYHEALALATQARTELAHEVEEAFLLRHTSRRITDPSVARLCLIATLYKDILDSKGTDTDHSILTSPYFGVFSTLDLVHLLEGDDIHSPGLATLDLEGYGTVMPTREGWSMLLDDEVYLLSAETLHTLLVHPGNTTQESPYFCPGVLPSIDWRPHLDGMSIVVVPQEFTLSGEDPGVCEIAESIRLSLHYERYAALVWSVAYARYGLEAFKVHHETTLACFGESRLPRNACEAQFWMDVFTYRGWSEEEQQKCFLPGYPFCHLTKEVMSDMTTYQCLIEQRDKKGKK